MPQLKQSLYRCLQDKSTTLTAAAEGLVGCNDRIYPFAPKTKVPVFAEAAAGSSEYSVVGAAERHDNSLRWLFQTFGATEQALRENLVERLQLRPGQSLLVTGAGAGNDLPYIAEKMAWQGTIYAQDIAAQMLLAGEQRHGAALAERGIDIHFSIGDATNLPFGDASFDAAYHYGGINLFPSVAAGIAEMNRVVRPGGRVVISDEGLAPWLRTAEIGRQLIANNVLYACEAPLASLPETARDVRLSWELHNCFYVIDYVVGADPLPIDIDVPHVGLRGGSIRTRYFGQLEGVDPALKQAAYDEAERSGLSRVEFLERALRAAVTK